MIKLLFWGFIGYVVYRFFQVREMMRENRQRQFEEQQRQQKFERNASVKKKSDGEFIDYEELK